MSYLLKLIVIILAFALHILGYAVLNQTFSAEPFSPHGSTILVTFFPAFAAIWATNVTLTRRTLAWAGGLAVASAMLWVAKATSLQSLIWINGTFKGSVWLSALTLYSLLLPTLVGLSGWLVTGRILKSRVSVKRLAN